MNQFQASLIQKKIRVGMLTKDLRILMENLTPDQCASLQDEGYFEVIGGRSGRSYKVKLLGGISGNIEARIRRKHRRLCTTMRGRIPIGDLLLAQKTAIELDEKRFLNVAVMTPPTLKLRDLVRMIIAFTP